MSILYAWIFALSISLTIAVQLDGDCTVTTECEGTGLLCEAKKCQCNIPSYKPCKAVCEVNSQTAYQGDDCEVEGNCLGNMDCRNKKCECKPNFTPKNGLCFKNLNDTCTNNNDCWSGYCSNSRCTCGPGYEVQENTNTCQRKLVDVYENWDQANAANAFCSDDSSCKIVVAKCHNDSMHLTTKFCKCPYGYKFEVNNNIKECKRLKGELSPLNNSVPSDYGQCGYCEDDNAACIKAGNQTTCWCRSGYTNRDGNGKCEGIERPKLVVIFPTLTDRDLNSFTNNCPSESNETSQISNKLCVCAPGYRFIAKDQPCEKIQLNWVNDVFEYGLCTQITSKDTATGPNGACPEPLKCEVRNDKHVCSCGKDKFRDEDDPTQCVYYIGKTTSSAEDKCPTKYSERNNKTRNCDCLPGYKPTNDNRRCEIKLSSEFFDLSSSNSNRSNDKICQDLFGNKSLLFADGECRCIQNESIANDNNTYCYAPLNQILVSPMANCPPNSALKTGRCQCDDSYRPSNDFRKCDRLKIDLVEYIGPSTTTNNSLTTQDCRAMFLGPVESYDNSRCQCKNEAFRNDKRDGCWYRLDVTLLQPNDTVFCPPSSTTGGGQRCSCEDGFRRDNDTCGQITNQVYNESDSAAPNITGISESICRKLFGQGADKSSNMDYCICKPNAYAVASNTYCHFLIDINSTDFRTAQNCPANTNIVSFNSSTACVCKQGYYASPNKRICETANITLNGSETMDSPNTTNCVKFTNEECAIKYGGQAFCKDEKCFCNQLVSSMNADGTKCESLPKYVFPGEHEQYLYSCNTEKDCNGKENVACDYLNSDSEYKVCKCKEGSLLDIKSQTCVEYKCEGCNTALNFECRDYKCQCKNGYYPRGSTCAAKTSTLQLYQRCNRTTLLESNTNDSLICDPNCERVQCGVAYRLEQSQCVRYQLNKDRCVGPNQDTICQLIDINAVCNREENQCMCGPSYYEYNNKCLRGVGSECTTDEDCGPGECKGTRCDCKAGQQISAVDDIIHRPIPYCINGIDQIRFNSVFLLFFVLARAFFT